jgi:cell division protein FtsB
MDTIKSSQRVGDTIKTTIERTEDIAQLERDLASKRATLEKIQAEIKELEGKLK